MTHNNNWPFSTDHVIRGTESMPEDIRNTVRAMYHYARANELTISDVSTSIKLHVRNVDKLCRGRYDGNLEEVAERITAWLEACKTRQAGDAPLFVKTDTASDIWDIATLAWQYRTIGAVWGDSQIGKTAALEALQRQYDPGIVKFMRFPAGASRMIVIQEVAKACGLPPRKGLITTVRQRIFDSIPKECLFIWDEVHEPFATSTQSAQKYAMELIREVHDVCKCGMLICGTNVGRTAIEDGILKDLLVQLRRRNVFTLQLPHYAPLKDTNAIARHFGLPAVPKGPARELVAEIVRRNGLNAYLIHLKAGRQLAENRSQAMTWQHVITAYDLIAKFANKKKGS